MPQPEPSPPVSPRPFPWRRLFQYRLRTLLILTAIISIWMGWWSYKARQQREVVAAVKNTGGAPYYDFMRYGYNRPHNWPAWLVDAMGVDYFADVIQVTRSGANFADKDLEHLTGLTKLHYLNLKNTRVTDAGLKYLRPMKELDVLILDNCKVTDVGMQHIARLTSLSRLGLNDTQISDSCLEQLKGLRSLEYLSIHNTKITDAGLKHLKGSMVFDLGHVLTDGTRVDEVGPDH